MGLRISVIFADISVLRPLSKKVFLECPNEENHSNLLSGCIQTHLKVFFFSFLITQNLEVAPIIKSKDVNNTYWSPSFQKILFVSHR